MKTTSINLRVSIDLRNQLEELAVEKNISTSELTRSIIEDFFNSSKDIRKTIHSFYTIENLPENDLLRSFEFTQLIFWIYDKRLNPELNETEEFYIQHMALIKKLKYHPFFGVEILKELNKVSNEIEDYLINKNYSKAEFYFSRDGFENSFNYDLFSELIYGLGYSDENNELITYKG